MVMVVWIEFMSGLGAHLGFCFLKDRQLASLLCLQSGG